MSIMLTQADYYLIYRGVQEQNQASTEASRAENDLHTCNGENHNFQAKPASRSEPFWTEFEWTDDERQKTADLLSQNRAMSDILANNAAGRGEYLIQKLEVEAGSNWDKFYKVHEMRFFKDRHYLEKAFPDEFRVVYGGGIKENLDEGISRPADDYHEIVEDFTIVEIGCGVGNAILPLLVLNPLIEAPEGESANATISSSERPQKRKRRISIWALDFSKVAVEILRKDVRYVEAQSQQRALSAVWDITKTHPRDVKASTSTSKSITSSPSPHFSISPIHTLQETADISLLLFCLSAVSPEKMSQAAKNVAATLKPGGMLLLRDYGRYDEAQIKLGSSRGKRLSENFYVKHDSTRVYYFVLEDLERLFGKGGNDGGEEGVWVSGAGLEIVELKYIQRVYKNRSDNTQRRRVWVQGRFRKPI